MHLKGIYLSNFLIQSYSLFIINCSASVDTEHFNKNGIFFYHNTTFIIYVFVIHVHVFNDICIVLFIIVILNYSRFHDTSMICVLHY